MMATKKKKEEEVKAEPVISKLPIPISDSPLVIDLPDGQKLVVGKMIQGTVIEVATWRGTGRPDSRTSRLMLGMSVGDVNPTPEQKAAEAAANGGEGAPATRTSKISNPYLAKAQEFVWSVTSHPIMKKLFGKPEPKKPRSPKPVTSETAPSAAPSISTPAEPVSPFTQTAPAKRIGKKERPKASGFSTKLFGKKKARPAGSPVNVSAYSPSTSTSSSSPDIDAWLDEISSKAKARVEKSDKQVKKSPAPAARKTAKKAAPVAKKKK